MIFVQFVPVHKEEMERVDVSHGPDDPNGSAQLVMCSGEAGGPALGSLVVNKCILRYSCLMWSFSVRKPPLDVLQQL